MSASVRWFRGSLACLAVALGVCVCAGATEAPALCPQPQQIRGIPGELEIDVSKGYVLHVASGGSAPVENAAARLVSAIEKAHGVKPVAAADVVIIIGVAGAFRDAARSVKPPGGLLTGAADLPTEGYVLRIARGRAWVIGRDGRGALYGTETLMQLLKAGPEVPALDIRDFPDTPLRMSYVGGGGKLGEGLKRIVRLAVHYKLNMLVFENDAFYHLQDAKVAENVSEVFDYCRSMGIEPVPELQSFGWSQCILPIDPVCVEAELREEQPFVVAEDGFATHNPRADRLRNARKRVPLGLANADFEACDGDSVTGWQQDDVGLTIFVEQGPSGGKVLRITREASGMSRIWQTVPCEVNRTYALDVDMKTDAAEGLAAFFEVYAGNKYLTAYRHIDKTTDWERRRLVFHSGEGRSLTIYLRIQTGTGTAWFDNVSCAALPMVEFDNGGFEKSAGDALEGWEQDGPGRTTFVEDRRAGGKCLRITRETPGAGRAWQTIYCEPDRDYVLEVDMKTEAGEGFRAYFEVYGGSVVLAAAPAVTATTGWQRRTLHFFSGTRTVLTAYVRIQDGVGSAWFDNVVCKDAPAPMINVVRTDEMPVVVKSAQGDVVYEQGRDYEIIPGELKYPFKADVEPTRIRIKPAGRLKAGDELRVSYHWAPPKSITYCPSEPRTQAIMKKAVQQTIRLLKPRFVHIGHDEPRVVNRDARCRRRKMKKHELFADDVRRIHGYANEADPEVRLMMWNDALTLNIREEFTLEEGTRDIPKDIVICAWQYGAAEAGYLHALMKSFTDLGYQVTGSPWCDATNTRAWGGAVKQLRSQAGDKCLGIFLTTWAGRWDMLVPCSDLMWTLSSPSLEGSPKEIADQVKRLYAGFETVR